MLHLSATGCIFDMLLVAAMAGRGK